MRCRSEARQRTGVLAIRGMMENHGTRPAVRSLRTLVIRSRHATHVAMCVWIEPIRSGLRQSDPDWLGATPPELLLLKVDVTKLRIGLVLCVLCCHISI